MSSQAALQVYQGETLNLTISYTEQDGTPVAALDGAAAEIRFSDSAEQEPISGTVDAEQGTIDFSIPDSTTQGWPTSGGGVLYQVWLTDSQGDKTMIVDGTIQVSKSL